MLGLVFEMFYDAFDCVLTTLKTVKLEEGISLWTWILSIFIGYGLVRVLLNAFNLGLVRDSTTATYAKYQAQQKKTKEKTK